ncbi:Uncharacterized protein FWK35_00020855, partial [Aphis craccivora]
MLTYTVRFKKSDVIATFYRCNLDGINCEHFQTWKLTDICQK